MTETTGTVSDWVTARRVDWVEAAPTRKLAGWLFPGLALGLASGPLISNAHGWQVTADAARVQAAAAVLESKAEICVARARAAHPAAAGLDRGARRELASRWAVMPGSTFADADVTTACTQGLARRPARASRGGERVRVPRRTRLGPSPRPFRRAFAPRRE